MEIKKQRANSVSINAERTGLEPATSCVTGRHSNQLNYRSSFYVHKNGKRKSCKPQKNDSRKNFLCQKN